MSDTFHLLDLPSQALAVQRLLCGRSEAQKLAWLGVRGKLAPVETRVPGARPVYRFETVVGLRCGFFIEGDEFVSIGDHTTYTVKH